MRLVLPTICALVLGSATPAAADYYFHKQGSYFFSGNVIEGHPPAAASPLSERPFFTPVSGYRRDGFECVPLMEIARVKGRVIKTAGTVCRVTGI